MTSIKIKTEPLDCTSQNQNLLCRLCMSKESLDSIFKEDNLHRWIRDYLLIEVSPEDCLSQVVCVICRLWLTEFNRFRIHSLEVQTALKSTINEDGRTLDDIDLQSKSRAPNNYWNQNIINFFSEKLMDQQTTDVQVGDYMIQIPLEIKPEPIDEDESTAEPQLQQGFSSTQQTKEAGKMVSSEENTVAPGEVKETCSDDDAELPLVPLSLSEYYPFRCDDCEKGFMVGSKLKQHRKYVHGVKKYVCSVCEKRFAYRHHLERHTKTHGSEEPVVKEKPFKCDKCPKAFELKSSLLAHAKHTHEPKLFQCPICGFRFSFRYKLEKHMNIHNRNNENGKEFPQLQDIQKNEASSSNETVTHQQDSPIQRDANAALKECTKCHRTFSNQRSLWNHYKFVHNPNVFECTTCGLVFESETRLEKHKSTVHK